MGKTIFFFCKFPRRAKQQKNSFFPFLKFFYINVFYFTQLYLFTILLCAIFCSIYYLRAFSFAFKSQQALCTHHMDLLWIQYVQNMCAAHTLSNCVLRACVCLCVFATVTQILVLFCSCVHIIVKYTSTIYQEYTRGERTHTSRIMCLIIMFIACNFNCCERVGPSKCLTNCDMTQL